MVIRLRASTGFGRDSGRNGSRGPARGAGVTSASSAASQVIPRAAALYKVTLRFLLE